MSRIMEFLSEWVILFPSLIAQSLTLYVFEHIWIQFWFFVPAVKMNHKVNNQVMFLTQMLIWLLCSGRLEASFINSLCNKKNRLGQIRSAAKLAVGTKTRQTPTRQTHEDGPILLNANAPAGMSGFCSKVSLPCSWESAAPSLLAWHHQLVTLGFPHASKEAVKAFSWFGIAKI